mgnify:FL=1
MDLSGTSTILSSINNAPNYLLTGLDKFLTIKDNMYNINARLHDIQHKISVVKEFSSKYRHPKEILITLSTIELTLLDQIYPMKS